METTLGFTAYALSDKTHNILSVSLNDTMQLYNKSFEITKVWDSLQINVSKRAVDSVTIVAYRYCKYILDNFLGNFMQITDFWYLVKVKHLNEILSATKKGFEKFPLTFFYLFKCLGQLSN